MWTSLSKEEAGEYDCPEMSSRRVDGIMGVNWEAAPPRLDVDKQEGGALERTPNTMSSDDDVDTCS